MREKQRKIKNRVFLDFLERWSSGFLNPNSLVSTVLPPCTYSLFIFTLELLVVSGVGRCETFREYLTKLRPIFDVKASGGVYEGR